MKIIDEFKQFAMRGNVMDMAVGVIIGAAFGKIVNSLVADLLMPPIGMLTGGVDFSDKALVLKPAAEGAKAVTLNYGAFIAVTVDFLIVAFAIFMLIKGLNRLKKHEEAPPPPAPTTKACKECLMDIPLAAKRCGHCTSVLA